MKTDSINIRTTHSKKQKLKADAAKKNLTTSAHILEILNGSIKNK
jgi:hypothetical protein